GVVRGGRGGSEGGTESESGGCHCGLLQAGPGTAGLEYGSRWRRNGRSERRELRKAKQRRSVFILLRCLVEPLDLGALAQLGNEVGLCLARQIGFDLVLHLLEFRRLPGALVFDLDDVPAELRLHRVRKLPWIHLEG